MTWAFPATPACMAYPSRVSAHDLDDHDALVVLGRGVQTVDGLGGDGDGGVEAEGRLSVHDRLLSMVLGTPTIFMPFLAKRLAMRER